MPSPQPLAGYSGFGGVSEGVGSAPYARSLLTPAKAQRRAISESPSHPSVGTVAGGAVHGPSTQITCPEPGGHS